MKWNNLNLLGKIFLVSVIVTALGLVAGIIGSFSIGFLATLRIFFGSIYVLFLPGFILTFVFFNNKIDLIERLALSFALSIAIVPLVVFYLNLMGIKINTLNTSLIILGIIILELIILHLMNKRKRYSY